jgi:hypothetical protein
VTPELGGSSGDGAAPMGEFSGSEMRMIVAVERPVIETTGFLEPEGDFRP